MGTVAFIFISSTIIWCLPGLYLSAALNVSRKRTSALVLVCGWCLNAAIGYAVFWFFFVNRFAGIASLYSIYVAILAMLISLKFQPKVWKELRAPDVWIPTALMLVTAVFYLSILTDCQGDDPRVNAAAHRFLSADLPSDNLIPRIFANRLYTGELFLKQPDGSDPRILLGNGTHFGTWRSSDRPPLQTGIELIQLPIAELMNWDVRVQHHVAGLLVQCIWIPALWALCRALKIPVRTIAIVLTVCIFSGFFLLNSLYVWPKLLAAGLGMLALAVIVGDQWRSAGDEISRACLAASLAALGMLAHAGVALFYPAIAIVAWRFRFVTQARAALLSAFVFALWLLPWTAYQKFYDPPGNHLLKWHLAGDIEIDDRSFLQALCDAYSTMTISKFASNKWENSKALFGSDCKPVAFIWPSREDQFYHVFKTLGVLNAGWLALIALAGLWSADIASLKRGAMLLAMALASMLLWILVLYLPGGTVIHSGSYALIMALFAGLAILISNFPIWFAISVLGIQIFHFMLSWAFGDLPAGAALRPGMAAFTVAMALGILGALAALARSGKRWVGEQ